MLFRLHMNAAPAISSNDVISPSTNPPSTRSRSPDSRTSLSLLPPTLNKRSLSTTASEEIHRRGWHPPSSNKSETTTIPANASPMKIVVGLDTSHYLARMHDKMQVPSPSSAVSPAVASPAIPSPSLNPSPTHPSVSFAVSVAALTAVEEDLSSTPTPARLLATTSMESLNRPRRISTATTASAYSTCSSSPSIHLDDEEGNTGGGETTDGEVLHPHTEETVQRIPGLLVPRRPKSASTLSGRMSPTSTIKGGTRSSDNETTLRRSASGVSSSDSPSRRQPERQMRKIFKGLIPDDEVFFEDHMCAYQREKGMLVQGKMYLTEGFLLFHANILGFVTRVVVGWGEVEEVRKGKTAFVFPNAVIVRLKDRVDFYSSFLNREQAYTNIRHLITRYHQLNRLPPLPCFLYSDNDMAATMPAYSPSSSPSPPSSVPSSRSPSFNHGAPSQPVHSSLLIAAAAAATTAGTPTSDIPITAPIRPSDSTQTLLDDHDPTDEPTQPLLTRKWLRTKPSSKDESSSSEREIERRFLERVNSFDKRELEREVRARKPLHAVKREDGEDEGGAPPPSPRLRKRRSWGPPVPLQLETVGMGEGAGSPLSPFLRSRRVVEEPERVAVAVGEGEWKGDERVLAVVVGMVVIVCCVLAVGSSVVIWRVGRVVRVLEEVAGVGSIVMV